MHARGGGGQLIAIGRERETQRTTLVPLAGPFLAGGRLEDVDLASVWIAVQAARRGQ